MNNKRFLFLIVSIAICFPLLAQTSTQQPPAGTQQAQAGVQPPSTAQSGGDTEQQIRSLEEQLKAALLKNDSSFLEQHTTNDYVHITGMTGQQLTRDRVVQDLKSGDVRYQALETRNISVRTFGNTAIVNGEATVSLMNKGQPRSGTFRFTRVWVKQDGDWKIASFESTPEQPQSK